MFGKNGMFGSVGILPFNLVYPEEISPGSGTSGSSSSGTVGPIQSTIGSTYRAFPKTRAPRGPFSHKEFGPYYRGSPDNVEDLNLTTALGVIDPTTGQPAEFLGGRGRRGKIRGTRKSSIARRRKTKRRKTQRR